MLDARDDDDCFTLYDPWRWYNIRASCHYNNVYFHNKQELALQRKIQDSRFATVMRTEMDRNLSDTQSTDSNSTNINQVGYRWNKRWFRETQDLSRANLRVLMMLRTGHDRLKYYTYWAHNNTASPVCACDVGNQTIKHLLSSCSLPKVRLLRRTLQITAQVAET